MGWISGDGEMNKLLNASLASAAILIGAAISGSAAATTINFDTLGNGVTVTTQYAGVTFSSDAGEVIRTTAQVPPYLTSAPNFICTGPAAGSIDCTHSVNLDFAGPVSGLSFHYTGADTLGSTFNVDVFEGFVYFGSTTFTSSAGLLASQLADLTGYSNITRISINKLTDPAGLGFDDFTFTPGGGTHGVPEPTAWALMIIGTGLVGTALRRRRDRALTA